MDTSTTFWPELNVYQPLTANARLMLQSRYVSGNKSLVSGAYGELEVTRFSSTLLRRVSLLDGLRARQARLRAGYRNVLGDTIEHRLQAEAKLQWPLGGRILASIRNRVDFRLIDGVYSWRHRTLGELEREFKALGRMIRPYIAAEVFYDSRYSTFGSWRYTGGAEFPLSRRWALEPFYTRQVTKQPELQLVNIVAFRIHFYAP